ncbi:hypothetical protein ACSMXN_16025 [Jatrophihabitans sp. DSM 45814]
MQFAILLLLVVALGLLVIGIVANSAALVTASIVISVLAAMAVLRIRRLRSRALTVLAAGAAPGQRAEPEARQAGLAKSAGPAEPAMAETVAPLSRSGDVIVRVVHGRPRYHLSSCEFINGRASAPVALTRAVEDGFTPCALCDPDTALGK